MNQSEVDESILEENVGDVGEAVRAHAARCTLHTLHLAFWGWWAGGLVRRWSYLSTSRGMAKAAGAATT